jgi:hypothetical protein
MGDDPGGVTSLPMTVSARRNARLRAAALATIPFVLFLVAAIPRVWAPDLVPFGEPQAAYVSEAIRRAPVSLWTLYTDPTVPALALLDPLLRHLPSPVIVWVIVRGLLDAVGVSLLYLAARPLVGIWPAVLAALLYAANPYAWMASRDPAGALGAVVTTAVLFAAVRLIRRRTWLRSTILALAVLLIGVPALLRIAIVLEPGWPDTPVRAVPAALTIPLSLIPFLLVLPLASRGMLVRVGGMAVVFLLGLATVSFGMELAQREQGAIHFKTLRDWSALASTVREAASRVGIREVVMPDRQGDITSSQPLKALLRDDVLVRQMEAAAVLPLEREAVFVLGSYSHVPVELRRASSAMVVATPDGEDTDARVVALRPRPLADWLARVQAVPNGGFSDGSRLVGVTTELVDTFDGMGQTVMQTVLLYWQIPATGDGRSIAVRGRALDQTRAAVATADVGAFTFPAMNVRRGEEILVVKVATTSGSESASNPALRVSLVDADGRPIRTASGADALDIPPGSASR